MAEHKLFYFPYASLTNQQLPLLKVAALYFDKIVILEPTGASWDTIGADHVARDALKMLESERILEVIGPAEVLKKYDEAMKEAILRDMADREFLELCEAHSKASGKQRWTLSLAKVPQDLQTDKKMRHLMGDFARDVASKTASGQDTYRGFAEGGQFYDEIREGYQGSVEYRYADFPLALGEAIMINHALFAGLLTADAIPITDDPFHNRVLSLKLRRAKQEPAVQEARTNRERQIKGQLLAATALTDQQLNLPVLNPKLPLAEVLNYRQDHDAALREVRKKLGWMARRIEAEPWSDKFVKELESTTIPDLNEKLEEVCKTRNDWLKSNRTRLTLRATGIGAGAAAVVLSVFTAPLIPVALVAAGLGLVSDTFIPGTEWLLDWRDGKKSMKENGLHYLLMPEAKKRRKLSR